MQRTSNLGLYTVADSEEFAYQQLINENMETIDALGESYVTERRRYGDYWFVERHSDRYCRCVMRAPFSNVATSTQTNGVWRSSDMTYALPVTFAALQHAVVSVNSTSTVWASFRNVLVDRVVAYLMCDSNATSSGWVNVSVEGWLP